MAKLTELSILEAKKLILDKQVSVVELVKAHIENIQRLNEKLNAFIELTTDLALAKAAESDDKIKQGKAGIIEGMPIGVKDLFCTKDVRTTACSKMLFNFIPQYESTVTTNLFKNGGIMLGKTNMDEFAMGSSNTHSYFGSVRNPWTQKSCMFLVVLQEVLQQQLPQIYVWEHWVVIQVAR